MDTPVGRPSAAGSARLELARLRLGLSPERVSYLEKEIRARLVAEVFSDIDVLPLLGKNCEFPGDLGSIQVTINSHEESRISFDRIEIRQNLTVVKPCESALRLIGKAIRLAPTIALRLFFRAFLKGHN